MAKRERKLVIDGESYSAPIDLEIMTVKGKATETASYEALGAFEHAIAMQVVEHQAMGPEACSFLRARVGETAEVLHKALGVDRKTFYRWSKGQHPMPRAVWMVFARVVLDREEGRTDTLDMLRSLASVEAA